MNCRVTHAICAQWRACSGLPVGENWWIGGPPPVGGLGSASTGSSTGSDSASGPAAGHHESRDAGVGECVAAPADHHRPVPLLDGDPGAATATCGHQVHRHTVNPSSCCGILKSAGEVKSPVSRQGLRKTSVTQIRSPATTTPIPTCVKSRSRMFARWLGEFMNALCTPVMLGLYPTFSPRKR